MIISLHLKINLIKWPSSVILIHLPILISSITFCKSSYFYSPIRIRQNYTRVFKSGWGRPLLLRVLKTCMTTERFLSYDQNEVHLKFCDQSYIEVPDSNDMLDPRGHNVDRPHSLRGSDVGNPRGPNVTLLVGATWNPHDGSTSDPHMPECRFRVEPTFVYLILYIKFS